MNISFLGTTMLLFDDGTDQILFDAHITRPSIPRFLFTKLRTDEEMAEKLADRYQMERVRGIFISHSHYDHALDLPFFAHYTEAEVYGSASTLNIARGGYVPEDHLHEFRTHTPIKIGAYTITVLPSVHSRPKWYNDDLGQPITEPLSQPAGKKAYKEGGSYDFLVEHAGRSYLIRPSFNYLEGELDGVHADVLFLGIAGITKFLPEERTVFYQETVEKVQPELIIPVHWDNFFVSLDKPTKQMPRFVENTEEVMRLFKGYCREHGIRYKVQMPLTTIHI